MINKDDRRYLNSSSTSSQQYLAMGSNMCHQEAPVELDRAIIRCRQLAARLLGQLLVHYDPQKSMDVLNYLTNNLNYRSAVQRMVVGMIVSEWAKVESSINISCVFLSSPILEYQ